MSTSNKAVLAALLSALALAATAGVVADRSRNPAPAEPAVQGGYVLRCWQDGRLILEEQHVGTPTPLETATTRLQLQDRNRQPLYIAETRNATCLVRAVPAARGVKSARP